jgi:hypothetical protein
LEASYELGFCDLPSSFAQLCEELIEELVLGYSIAYTMDVTTDKSWRVNW